MSKIAGYCKLCRAKELELYDTILNKAGRKHSKACEEAGCKHPADYADLADIPVDPVAKAEWDAYKASKKRERGVK